MEGGVVVYSTALIQTLCLCHRKDAWGLLHTQLSSGYPLDPIGGSIFDCRTLFYEVGSQHSRLERLDDALRSRPCLIAGMAEPEDQAKPLKHVGLHRTEQRH